MSAPKYVAERHSASSFLVETETGQQWLTLESGRGFGVDFSATERTAARLNMADELAEALRILVIEIGEGGRRGRAIDLLSRKTVDVAQAAVDRYKALAPKAATPEPVS